MADAQEELRDVLVAVLGCNPSDIKPGAALTDLGATPATLVEIANELAQRVGGWIPDDLLGSLETVADLAAAAHAHRATPPPVWMRQAALAHSQWDPATGRTTVSKRPTASRLPTSRARAGGIARRLVIRAGITGAAVGLLALLATLALGIWDFRMPPLTTAKILAGPTPSATPTPSAEPTATTTPTPENAPAPTLTASSDHVAPQERFTLSGAFPLLAQGTVLQVQLKNAAGSWDDFPVAPVTSSGGSFSTQIWLAASGTYTFRVTHPDDTQTSPEVTVSIG